MIDEPPARPDVTYGVVLENTSTAYLAILTLVTVQLTDADGNRANDTVRTPPSDPAQAVQTIFPGQRIGIGDQVYLDRQGIVEMTVEVGESSWMPVEQVRDGHTEPVDDGTAGILEATHRMQLTQDTQGGRGC